MIHDVAIIGAGPAGLCLARALSGQGLSIVLLERQAETALADPAFDGREIALTHASQALLEQLGLWQRLPAEEVAVLRDAAERSRQMEVERALKLLARGEAAEDVIRQLSLRLSNKLLHAPSSTLNSADGSERAFLQAGAERLFHLHDAPVQHIKRRRQQGR